MDVGTLAAPNAAALDAAAPSAAALSLRQEFGSDNDDEEDVIINDVVEVCAEEELM